MKKIKNYLGKTFFPFFIAFFALTSTLCIVFAADEPNEEVCTCYGCDVMVETDTPIRCDACQTDKCTNYCDTHCPHCNCVGCCSSNTTTCKCTTRKCSLDTTENNCWGHCGHFWISKCSHCNETAHGNLECNQDYCDDCHDGHDKCDVCNNCYTGVEEDCGYYTSCCEGHLGHHECECDGCSYMHTTKGHDTCFKHCGYDSLCPHGTCYRHCEDGCL